MPTIINIKGRVLVVWASGRADYLPAYCDLGIHRTIFN